MSGKYLLPVIGFIGASTLACAAPQYNAPDRSDSYKKQYEQRYSPEQPAPQSAPPQPAPQHAPQPPQKPVVKTTQPQQKQLTMEEMLVIKQKIETADAYDSRDLPGNALVSLLEAKEMAAGNFFTQVEPRIDVVTKKLKEFIDVYKVNIRVVDATGSGRAEYIQYKLQDKQYKPGLEVVGSGGYYTLTLELRTIEVDEKRKVQSYMVQIPTGTTQSMNGEYAALQQTVNIKCADYFAKRDAAQGAGLQAISAGAQTINTINVSGGSDILSTLYSIGKVADAGSRLSAQSSASSQCEQAQEELQGTPMFTRDTVTTPYRYEEKTTRKTATAGIRVSLTTQKGATIFASPPLDVEFLREDVAREEIAVINIHGDPEESIDDKEVIRGVLQAVPDEVYALTNQGSGLWDVIALQNAQARTGERALEEYVQLYFDGHRSETKKVALDYIVDNTDLAAEQLERLR